MPAPDEENGPEKIYPIPDRVLIEWQKMSESGRVLSKAAEAARSQATGAHVLMLGVLGTWFGLAFLTEEGRQHRSDFWMYLLAAQVVYFFSRRLFTKNE